MKPPVTDKLVVQGLHLPKVMVKLKKIVSTRVVVIPKDGKPNEYLDELTALPALAGFSKTIYHTTALVSE